MDLYSGKTVLVTGATRGVGRIIAEHFLSEGAQVIGFARGEASFESENYRHVQVDLADPMAIQPARATARPGSSAAATPWGTRTRVRRSVRMP